MPETATLLPKAALIAFASDPEAVKQARKAARKEFPEPPPGGENYLVWCLLRWSGWGGPYCIPETLYKSLLRSGVRVLDARHYSSEAGDLFWIPSTGVLGIVAKGNYQVTARFRGIDRDSLLNSRKIDPVEAKVTTWLRLPG